MVTKSTVGAESVRAVRNVTLAGLFLNLLLFVLKLFAGIAGSSKAVTADAFHTLTDLTTDLAVILGVKWWMSPPDKNHPYGHRRIEALVTLFVGAVLGLGGVLLGVDGIVGLGEGVHAPPRLFALAAALVSIVLKEFMYHFTARAGRRMKSSALLANAWHHRSDAISSIPAAIAVGVSIFFPNLSFVDHVGEILVAVIIIRAAYKIARRSMVELSDGVSSQKDAEEVGKIVEGVAGVRGVHAIRCRRVGPGLHVDMHLHVDSGITVKAGHDISEEVKVRLEKDGPDVVDAIVHIEPYEGDEG